MGDSACEVRRVGRRAPRKRNKNVEIFVNMRNSVTNVREFRRFAVAAADAPWLHTSYICTIVSCSSFGFDWVFV